MTQAELFEPALHLKVAGLFMDRPNQWIDGMEIAKVGGIYGWRTRCSECRKLLGMEIENRVRQVGKYRVSEYRYIPKSLQRAS